MCSRVAPNWASPGQDINTASSGIVLFAAGSATATLTFDAINDLQAENTESFTVSISPDSNFTNPSYTSWRAELGHRHGHRQ